MPNTSFTFLKQNYWAEEPGTQHVKSHWSNKQEKSTMMVEVLSGLDPLTSHQPKPLVIFFPLTVFRISSIILSFSSFENKLQEDRERVLCEYFSHRSVLIAANTENTQDCIQFLLQVIQCDYNWHFFYEQMRLCTPAVRLGENWIRDHSSGCCLDAVESGL